MENIVLIIHLLIAIALIAVVLMQRSEGGALGMGGGSGGGGGGMFSARGAANALTRTTAILAACFIATSLTLAIMAGGHRNTESIFDSAPTETTAPAPGDDGTPAVPTSE